MKRFYEMIAVVVVMGALYWVARELQMIPFLVGCIIGFLFYEFCRWFMSGGKNV